MTETSEVRIDKWLWAARFFKTRGLASEAVSGGKVHVNGQRCKPGKDVKIGDVITVSKDQYTWEIQVTDLNKQRRPAKEAASLYSEDEASSSKRQQQIEVHNSSRPRCTPQSGNANPTRNNVARFTVSSRMHSEFAVISAKQNDSHGIRFTLSFHHTHNLYGPGVKRIKAHFVSYDRMNNVDTPCFSHEYRLACLGVAARLRHLRQIAVDYPKTETSR